VTRKAIIELASDMPVDEHSAIICITTGDVEIEQHPDDPNVQMVSGHRIGTVIHIPPIWRREIAAQTLAILIRAVAEKQHYDINELNADITVQLYELEAQGKAA
jgi:hypothetical protein